GRKGARGETRRDREVRQQNRPSARAAMDPGAPAGIRSRHRHAGWARRRAPPARLSGKTNAVSFVFSPEGEMRTLMLCVCLAASAVVSAQQAPAGADSANFEVATLKQNKSGERGSGIRRLPGGRVTVTNMPARQLISFAYQ